MTKIDKVIFALMRGDLTRKQIAARFKIPNVRAILFDVKRKGYVLSTTSRRGTEYVKIVGNRGYA